MKAEKQILHLPLPIDNGHIYLIDDDLLAQKEELEKFLDGLNYMNSKDFSKKVLFGQEIKSNNTIEGYLDDISIVRSIIKHPINTLNEEQKQRVLNMYYGYKYILQGKDINKENLKELYSILSNKILSQSDVENMGEYYRLNEEFIFFSSNLNTEPDKGVDPKELEEKMNILLDYVNSSEKFSCMTDYFIRSQIIHFYFIYIHPYYDVNGRTARTTSMWYLLNHEVYPYIIFNRAIQLDKNKYYKVIRDGRVFHNVTFFLNYLLKNVLIELEKEYTMELISDSARFELTDADIQTLYYILSMKGLLTYYDFTAFYNHLNNHTNPYKAYSLMLEPLIDKEIIIPGKHTSNPNNHLFTLNSSLFEINDKNKHLSLENKIN